MFITSGLSSVASLISDNKALIDEKISSKWNHDMATFQDSPEVEMFATFYAWDSTKDLLYGFANGVVDVFPVDSLPDQCRDNTTTFYNAIRYLFVD